MKKRLLVLILLVALAAALPLAASAASSGTCGSGVKWSLSDSGVLTISGSGKMTDFNAANSSYSPWSRGAVKKVVIKDGVTRIGNEAFLGHVNMTNVTIGSGVRSIGAYAFQGCSSLTSLTIPANVTTIGECSFSLCGAMTSLKIEKGVKIIKDNAFWQCSSLKSVTIPSSVTAWGNGVLSECSHLTTLVVGMPDITDYAFSGLEALTTVTLTSTVKRIGYMSFSYCPALKSMKIGSGVTDLDSYPFYGSDKLSALTIAMPEIRTGAFYGLNSLTGVTILDGVKSVGDEAFRGCGKLKKVTIPNSVASFGENAFADCSSDLTIACNSGSQAHKYAKANGIKVSLPSSKPVITVQPKSVTVSEGTRATFKVTATGVSSYKWYYRTSSKGGWVAVSNNGASASHSISAAVRHNGYQYRCLVKNSKGSVYSNTVTLTVKALKTYTVKYNANSGTGAPSQQTKKENASLTLRSTKPTKKYTIRYNANGGKVSSASKSVSCTFKSWNTKANGRGTAYAASAKYTRNADVTLYAQWKNPTAGTLAKPTRLGYKFTGWYTAASGGTKITSASTVSKNTTLYAHWKSTGYTLGLHTYSFPNYGDSHADGHCFGMSMTSSGYYNGLLSMSIIGGGTLYSKEDSPKIRKPICYYQYIQGSYATQSNVVGGYGQNLQSVWKQTVAYVSDHKYDNKGLLQISFWKDGDGGHAVNFLRYKKVNGQDRLYVYDNNFPDQETYFYRDSSGRIMEAPLCTYENGIDHMAVRDSRIFFRIAGTYDPTRALYMPKNAARVEGYIYSIMVGGPAGEEYVMYEIPADEDQVVITPNRDYAKFRYMDEEYSFGRLEDDAYGEFTLASMDEGAATNGSAFTIVHTKPVITAQPESVTVNEDEKAAFRTAAENAEGYQWYYRKSDSGKWQKYAGDGADAATFSLTAKAAYTGYQFRCLVKNDNGSVFTDAAVLTVRPKPVITAQPRSVTVNEGEKATFTAAAENADTCQWYYRTSAGGKWQKYEGKGATASFSLTAKAAHNGYQFRCLVKNGAGSVYTDAATLTVHPKPVITAQPRSVTVNAGKKVTFKVVAEGADSYQWYSRKSESGTWQKVSENGAAATLSFTAKAGHNGYQYRCLVKNEAGSVYTGTVTVTAK